MIAASWKRSTSRTLAGMTQNTVTEYKPLDGYGVVSHGGSKPLQAVNLQKPIIISVKYANFLRVFALIMAITVDKIASDKYT